MSCSITLREVAEFQKGFAFKSKDYTSDGVKIIKVSNLTDDSVDTSQCVCVENDIADKYKDKYNLKTNDIVITTVGSWPTNPASVVGKVIRVPKYADNTLLNQNAVRLRSNSLINQNYMYYLLKDKSFKEYIVGTAQGSANQASITQEDIKNFEFILPSLEEQEKIANILSSLDDKIELNNEMNKTLEEMAQSIFKRWFVDFEFPNEDDQPYKSSGGEMVESELGMIPKGWEVKTIGDLCEVGSSKRIFMKEYVEEGIPFFRGKEVIQKSKGENISTELFITKERYKEIKDKFGVPSKNDILLTSVGTLGIPYLVDDEEFYFKDGNLTWFKNFNEEIFRYYVYQWLLSSEGKKSIDEVTIGSTQKALTINALKSMKLVIPSKNTLNKYQGFISSNIENIRENNVQKFNLIDLRDSLLPKLMSGVLKL